MEPVAKHHQQIHGDVLSLKDEEGRILSGLFPRNPQLEINSNTQDGEEEQRNVRHNQHLARILMNAHLTTMEMIVNGTVDAVQCCIPHAQLDS